MPSARLSVQARELIDRAPSKAAEEAIQAMADEGLFTQAPPAQSTVPSLLKCRFIKIERSPDGCFRQETCSAVPIDNGYCPKHVPNIVAPPVPLPPSVPPPPPIAHSLQGQSNGSWRCVRCGGQGSLDFLANGSCPPNVASVQPTEPSITVQSLPRATCLCGCGCAGGCYGTKPNRMQPTVLVHSSFVPVDIKMTKEPSYAKYAFCNFYNYVTMGALTAMALLAGDITLLIVLFGGEALWMLFAPGSRLLKRLWWDKITKAEAIEQRKAARQLLWARLERDDQARYNRLTNRFNQIVDLCRENTTIAQELLQAELNKVDRLVQSYLDLIVASSAIQKHLWATNRHDINSSIKDFIKKSEAAATPELQSIALQNAEILKKRLTKLDEAQAFVAQASAQLELIENTFALIADQIITLRSPQELGKQLDGLITGVEIVKSAALETARLTVELGV